MNIINKPLGNLFVIMITLSSIAQWTVLPIKNTTIWWFFYALIIYLLIRLKKTTGNHKLFYPIYLLLGYWLFSILRGAFIAEDYWEWKHLINNFFKFCIPFIVFLAVYPRFTQSLFASFIKYCLPLFPLLFLFIEPGAYGRYLFPISMISLFLFFVNKRWRLTLLLISLFVIFVDLGARSNVLKFLFPILFSLLFLVRSKMILRLLKPIRLIFLFLPFVLLYLGISNVFNVFKMKEYISTDLKVQSKNEEWEGDGDLTVDTRTFLYDEVLLSALRNNYVVLGRSPARGNDSLHFGPSIDEELNRNKGERFANEVGILNIFTWTGILGVLFYFLVFVRATFLGLYKSNNWSIKVVSIYLCFRWVYAWVEDFSRFDWSTILLFVCIGMCISPDFRNMTDKQFKFWVRGIFDIRYRKGFLKKQVVKLKRE